MAASPIQLNATNFTPSAIAENAEKVGVPIRAANGTRRFAHRALKKQWELSWETLTLAEVTPIRTIYNLTTTFTYRDENLTSYTVLCDSDALSITTSDTWPTDNTVYYDVTLTIKEA